METLSVNKMAALLWSFVILQGNDKSRQAAQKQKAAFYLRSNLNSFNAYLYPDMKRTDEGFFLPSLVQSLQDMYIYLGNVWTIPYNCV
jgi:hypothetical protein